MITQKARRQSKYGNKGCMIDDIKFSSQKEGLRYIELKRLKQAGIVQDFEMQVPYILQETFWKCCGDVNTNPKSKHVCPYCSKKMQVFKARKYIADFRVIYENGRVEIEDVKGRFMTEFFRLKWALFEYKYPELTLKIVTNVRGCK
jgi:hypothetical protein